MWGQSFFDVSIGGGVIKYNDIRFEGIDILTKNKLAPFGSLELRYSYPLVNKIWVSASMKFDIDDIDYEMKPAFTIGGTYSPQEWVMFTSGIFTKDDWFDYFFRTDIKLIDTEEGWIGGTFNVYDNKLFFGITFKDFIIK